MSDLLSIVWRMHGRLKEIRDMHLGDCPAGQDELAHAHGHIAQMRRAAHNAVLEAALPAEMSPETLGGIRRLGGGSGDKWALSERESAILLSEKVLNDPRRDPDSDLSLLARQFLRALERELPTKFVAMPSASMATPCELVDQRGTTRRTVEGALLAALDFLNEEYRDAQAAALDGDPISREARPVRDKIVAALKELS